MPQAVSSAGILQDAPAAGAPPRASRVKPPLPLGALLHARLGLVGGGRFSGSQNARTKHFPSRGAAGRAGEIRRSFSACLDGAGVWSGGWRLGSAGLVEDETSLPGAWRPARHPGVDGEVRRGSKALPGIPGPGGWTGILGERRISVPSPSVPTWGMSWG